LGGRWVTEFIWFTDGVFESTLHSKRRAPGTSVKTRRGAGPGYEVENGITKTGGFQLHITLNETEGSGEGGVTEKNMGNVGIVHLGWNFANADAVFRRSATEAAYGGPRGSPSYGARGIPAGTGDGILGKEEACRPSVQRPTVWMSRGLTQVGRGFSPHGFESACPAERRKNQTRGYVGRRRKLFWGTTGRIHFFRAGHPRGSANPDSIRGSTFLPGGGGLIAHNKETIGNGGIPRHPINDEPPRGKKAGFGKRAQSGHSGWQLNYRESRKDQDPSSPAKSRHEARPRATGIC